MSNPYDYPSGCSRGFAYADPPYPGQAKRLYGKHPDYAGEVDHRTLIARLTYEYDGWALSTSMKALPSVLRHCPDNVYVLAWVKPISPPMGDHRIYNWEPLIMRPLRQPGPGYVRMSITASPPQFTFRPRPASHVIGEKPAAFAEWLFEAAGLVPGDRFVDLYPGSGAVGRAWDEWRRQSA